jgi:nucleotide-binding universal stress UspA family protein
MFKVVLWATDGSAAAERAFPAAKSIAESHDARLLVTHVREVIGGAPPVVYSLQENMREHADEVEAALRRRVEDLKRDGVKAEFVPTGMAMRGAAHAIAELARDVNADLIIVGTRGHNPLVRLLVGSVTRRLLELAPCPVLAVPPESERAQS